MNAQDVADVARMLECEKKDVRVVEYATHTVVEQRRGNVWEPVMMGSSLRRMIITRLAEEIGCAPDVVAHVVCLRAEPSVACFDTGARFRLPLDLGGWKSRRNKFKKLAGHLRKAERLLDEMLGYTRNAPEEDSLALQALRHHAPLGETLGNAINGVGELREIAEAAAQTSGQQGRKVRPDWVTSAAVHMQDRACTKAQYLLLMGKLGAHEGADAAWEENRRAIGP